MFDEQIPAIKSLLSIPATITILSHRNPDGDALGSSLGLKRYLETYGHRVHIVLPSECPSTFKYLRDFDQITIFDMYPDEARKRVQEANIIFCLDFNGLDRIDKLGEEVTYSKAIKVLLDHHLDPEPFTDYSFSDTEASSTCEIVYQFIEAMGDFNKIDLAIGEALFTGLITDTGSFKYATRPQTYMAAAGLKQRGVDDYFINDAIYNSLKEKHLRLLGHCLANRMTVWHEYSTAMIYLNKEDYKNFDIQRGDTEGIVNQMLMMDGIEMAAFITEQPSIIKISLRSKGDISVQQIAMTHFKGGGHKNASGGAVYAKLEDVIDRFKRIIPNYMKKRAL